MVFIIIDRESGRKVAPPDGAFTVYVQALNYWTRHLNDSTRFKIIEVGR